MKKIFQLLAKIALNLTLIGFFLSIFKKKELLTEDPVLRNVFAGINIKEHYEANEKRYIENAILARMATQFLDKKKYSL